LRPGRAGTRRLALFYPTLLARRSVQPFSLREPMFDAVAKGRVSGQVWDGYWTDIGTPEQLAEVRERDSESPHVMTVDGLAASCHDIRHLDRELSHWELSQYPVFFSCRKSWRSDPVSCSDHGKPENLR